MSTDVELLGEYGRNKSEEAFSELVRRHVNLVYSAAFRQVRSPQLAEEVAQSVFTDLGRNANTLRPDTILTAWLYQVTRRTAIDVIRRESRRQLREQIAVEMNAMNATNDDWTQIEPLLDDAMAALDDTDRTAVLLRYFENKSLREVGEQLGVSDDAAQKRVSRAVERLREFFGKQGVKVGAGALTAVVAANAVQAAPAGLTVAITTTAALAGTVAVSSTTIAATKIIAMTTFQKALIVATVSIAVGTGVFEMHRSSQLQEQIRNLQQQRDGLSGEIQQMRSERDAATNQAVGLMAENARLKSDSRQNELLKLRGEVGQLRQKLKDLPSARAALLKQKLEQMPDKGIPEMKFLTDKDWLNAAWNADLETSDGVRVALSKVRDAAADHFLGMTRVALGKYLQANGDMLPTNLLALKPFYDIPVTDEMLGHYSFLQSGELSSDPHKPVVGKTFHADPDYDSNQQMAMNGGSGGSYNRIHDEIGIAIMNFTTANNGVQPTSPSQITPYLDRQIDSETIQKYIPEITHEMASDPAPPEIKIILPALNAYKAANNGQIPTDPADLLPYVTTPEQQAALKKVMQDSK